MSEDLYDWNSFFLVSIGAIIGSWFRFKIIYYFERLCKHRFLGTFCVNIIATFFLGLTIALFNSNKIINNQQSLYLFLGIGFLGSLSTFSTFVMDLLNSLLENKLRKFLSISLSSISGGILAAFIGYKLGNV